MGDPGRDASDEPNVVEAPDCGEAEAAELFPLVYEELRALAGRYFLRQPEQTIQPTSLVHEAFLRLATPSAEAGAPPRFRSRGHFAAVAATAMRQILTDRARRRAAKKRGGGERPVTLTNVGTPSGREVDVIDLDRALTELAQIDPRRARVVELRYFGGLTVPEVAEQLGRSVRTVELDWRGARAWLATRLGRGEDA